jgi:hypothetical protein
MHPVRFYAAGVICRGGGMVDALRTVNGEWVSNSRQCPQYRFDSCPRHCFLHNWVYYGRGFLPLSF